MRRSVSADRLLGIVLALTSAVAFGIMPMLARSAYAHGATPPLLLAIRFTVATVALFALAALRRGTSRRDPGRVGARMTLGPLLLGMLGYGGTALAFFSALTFVPAGMASLLFYTYPALVVFPEAWRSRQWPGIGQWTALTFAVGGSGLVVGAGALSGPVDPRGVALALAAAVAYAAYILTSSRTARAVPPLELAAWVSAGALAAALLALALTGTDLPAASGQVWGAGVTLGLVSTAFAIAAFLEGLVRIGPVASAVLAAGEPLTTVTLAAATMGERLGPPQVVGAALVLSSMVLASIPKERWSMKRWRTSSSSSSPSGVTNRR